MRAASSKIHGDDPRRLPLLMRRCWYGLNQSFRRRIAHLGITPSQFTMLRWLIESGESGLVQRDLTELMASDANTIASLVHRMKEQGLICCRPDTEDKRAKRVRISTTGRKVYEDAKPIALELQHEVLESLSGKERHLFLRQLEKVAEACQGALTDLVHPNNAGD